MTNVLRAPQLHVSDPEYNGKNLTNHVLIKKQKNKLTYFCPGYLRIKIKNFSGMSHDDLQATINITLVFTINLKQVPQILKDQIKDKIILRFNRDDALLLDHQNLQVKMVEKEHEITYTVRKLLNAGMTSEVFLSPFEVINLILSITIQSITLFREDLLKKIDQDHFKQDLKTYQNFQQYEFRFNLMDLSEEKDFSRRFAKISFTEEGTFGNYDLAQRKLRVQYTNENTASKIRNISKKIKNTDTNIDYSKIQQYKYAHFQIPLYKFPIVSLVTIFLPLWLLGIMNLGIFFQDNGLADRIGSLAGLMIAFVALIPVIRDTLPPNPNITFVEILVYIETLTTLLCLIQSISVRESETVFQWNNNGLFLACMIIDIVEFVIIAILMIIHYCFWLPSYNLHANEQNQMKFRYQDWQNESCDAHFRRKIDNGEIVPLEYEQKQNKKHDDLIHK